MSRSRLLTSSPIALGIAAIAVLALAGCAAPGEAAVEETANTAPSAEPTPVETQPATPSAAPVDPADVTTWVITADAVGPLARGADAAEAIAGLPAFEADEWCPGVFGLGQEGSAQVTVTVLDDGTIGGVWVSGRDSGDGTPPAAPSTEAGISLGATMEELAASYSELMPTNQPGPITFGYAVGDDDEGYVNFLVDDGVVVTMGVQDRAAVPKELCG
ncbi:hypothetical protein [Agromyces sp. NPDC058126]|uniref:hypothetical protein n=1 Tax=Agromyces sp. NPDC058126 TaxID=3346350 RepID=UPI0036DF0895